MPRRSVSQDISEAVVPRWQALLEESGYIFRVEAPDYGLDGEVEEFVNGAATGLRYKVQLRGTDKPDLDKALRLSIRLSEANYWRAQDLPVLVVRYHKPTDQFYVRWFHAFDPYEGGVGKNGITFRWAPEDAWGPGRAQSLAAEARSFLALRSSQLPLPFEFGLEVDEGAHGLSEAEVRIAVQTAAQLRPDVVRILDRAPAAGEGRFIVTADRLVANLGSVTAATLHLPEGSTPDAHQIAFDLLMLAGVAFTRVGQAGLAGRMATSYLARSTLLAHFEATWDLSGAMARARQIHEALDLADEIDAMPVDFAGEASLPFTFTVMYHASSLTKQEYDRAVEVLGRRIERRADRGDRLEEARACVALANFFRTRAEPRRALELFDRAAECDPGYKDRAHYWEERAGVLFGLGEYNDSASAYQQALDLGSESHVLALHADALMFAGRYEEARAGFHRFVAEGSDGPRGAEYLLKLDVLDVIIEQFGVARQERRPPADLTVPLIDSDTEPSTDEARAVVRGAIDADARDPRAWELLGWAELKEGNLDGYARPMIAVAVLLEDHVEAWVHAVVFNLELRDGTLVPELLVTGQRLTGGLLLAALAEYGRENIPAGERGPWLTRVNDLFNAIPPQDPGGFALRVLGEEGEVSVFEMPTAESAAIEDADATRE